MKINRRKIDINKMAKEGSHRIWQKYDRGLSLRESFDEEAEQLSNYTTHERAWNLLVKEMEVILVRRINNVAPRKKATSIQRRSNHRSVHKLY